MGWLAPAHSWERHGLIGSYTQLGVSWAGWLLPRSVSALGPVKPHSSYQELGMPWADWLLPTAGNAMGWLAPAHS